MDGPLAVTAEGESGADTIGSDEVPFLVPDCPVMECVHSSAVTCSPAIGRRKRWVVEALGGDAAVRAMTRGEAATMHRRPWTNEPSAWGNTSAAQKN